MTFIIVESFIKSSTDIYRMWFAEFQFDGSQAPAGSLAKKHNITISTYPVSLTEEKNKLLIYFAGNLYGSTKDKELFIAEIKKSKRVHFLEENNDFLIILFEEPKTTKSVYQHNIIHTKPIIISSSGNEFWSVGSKNKENLMAFYKILRDTRNAKMVYIKQKRISNISIAQIHPELTEKQKFAIKLAIEEGYYEIPRKIDVQRLAIKSKLAFSTFQNHLRKAESKLIPYSFLKQ